MERICAWCNKKIDNNNQAAGEVIPKNLQNTTHGICNQCSEKTMKEITPISSFGDYIKSRKR